MMRPQDIVVVAASVAFLLAGAASVNDSEAINVKLPSQYQVIWDQSPYAAPVSTRQADLANRVPRPRLEVHVPSSIMPAHDYRTFARNYRSRSAIRG